MKKSILILLSFFTLTAYNQNELRLNNQDYFEMKGLNVTFFSDFYPEGHQSGVTIIQHGNRVAANGDVRLEPSPGQWSPVPAGGDVRVNREQQMLSKTLWYPDSSKNARGFNPVFYPEVELMYSIHLQAMEDNQFRIIVELDRPIPESLKGQAGFNLELFPGDLFGKAFIMEGNYGIFPIQPVGSPELEGEEYLTPPLAIGKELIISPGNELQRIVIRSSDAPLELRDGRSNHNNGWFILRSELPTGVTGKVMEWTVEPNVVEEWTYEPVIQVSQLGYHPLQEKKAVIETDLSYEGLADYKLFRLGSQGRELIKEGQTQNWGTFLRYNYETINFSEVSQPGMYQIAFEDKLSHPFRITEDVYSKNAWQPTLEYFLPVQMCHMRVNEKYRVWHGLCHMDDALMAPIDHNHFDGYKQGDETLTEYESGEHVPGLAQGGWHDAGDYDLRVESQIRTVWLLASMIEEFGLDHDATLIDPENHLVEIHHPDGENDAIQQIEHGLATILGGYRALGRLYRGIIASELRQYVMLGDAASMTNNETDPFDGKLKGKFGENDLSDDRWVFTENNPTRELEVAGGLAAASRVLMEINPELSEECRNAAVDLYSKAFEKTNSGRTKLFALSELILTFPEEKKYFEELYALEGKIVEDIGQVGWMMGRIKHLIENKAFNRKISKAVEGYQEDLKSQQRTDSPYGVPYKPRIWGAGWEIQRFGVEQYFFYKGWPEITGTELFENALHFVLGVHPGRNNSSFASGVGSESVTVAYGVNRADWSFIPGGVASGTALIRPDLPELKEWPFFWQQSEYVMGGGATNFMFLVLAVEKLYSEQGK